MGSILLGCRDCSGAVRPIPPALLQAQFVLCVLTALAYATSGGSARRRDLAVGLNALAFGGLLVATAHGIVAQEDFCLSCLLAWTGLGVALLLQSGKASIVRWWVPTILAGSLALRIATQGVGDSSLLLKGFFRKGLTSAGFDYTLPRTTLQKGDAVPGLRSAKGLVVFLTKCSPCTRKVLEAKLSQAKVSPLALTFVVADASNGWQAPKGYGSTRRIVDDKTWRAAGILRFGPPSLVQFSDQKVQEVLY